MLFQTHFLFFGASQKTSDYRHTHEKAVVPTTYCMHCKKKKKKVLRKLKFNQLDAIRFLDVFVH